MSWPGKSLRLSRDLGRSVQQVRGVESDHTAILRRADGFLLRQTGQARDRCYPNSGELQPGDPSFARGSPERGDVQRGHEPWRVAL